MRMRPKVVVFILLGLLCHYRGLTQDVHFTLVAPPKEQPWTDIYGITQDQQGYLWIRTSEGVYKYDGLQFTLYQHDVSNPNSIASNLVASFFADNDGTIWFGTVGAGLDHFDPITSKFTHYRHRPKNAASLANDGVETIIRDHEGVLWVGTENGLDKFEPKTGSFTHFIHNNKDPHSLSCNWTRIIYEDKQGTIWVGTGSVFPKEADKDQGGLNRLNRKTGKFTVYRHDTNDLHSLIDNRVDAIFEDSRGIFWVGTAGDGLHTMDRKKGTFERHLYDPAHPANLRRPPLKNVLDYTDDRITFINEDISGKIWIGTIENGINVYDPATQKTVWYGTDPKSNIKIARNEFINAFRSRDGVMWIAAFHGTEFYKVIPYNNKLPHHDIGTYARAFAEDSDNTIWMTTGKGLLHKRKDNIVDTFRIAGAPPWVPKPVNARQWMNMLFFIEKDAENNLWVTNWQGLYKFDRANKSFIPYYPQDGNRNSLINRGVMHLENAGANKMWVGTLQGLQLMDTKNGTFKNFTNDPKDTTTISNSLIQCIAISKNGTVWVSTDNGVNKLDKKTMHFKRYLMNMPTRHLLFDSHDNLWAGTDQGLYKYDEKTDNFVNFGRYRTAVFWISEDHENNLWLYTNYGLVKLNVRTLETNIYGKDQGVTNDIAFGYTLHNGEILAGDNTGYFAFYPDKILHNTPATIIVINSFYLADVPVLPTVDGVLSEPVNNTSKISLNHNQTNFSFGFTNIDFASEEDSKQTFYMLENYDNKWRMQTENETANYYNVPPGNYVFKVKGINGNGLVSQKQIVLTISQAWYKTLWAYIIFVILLIGAIWAFIYYRSLQLLKENRILEERVQARTEEVLQQKEEIETQRDGLEKTLVELKATQKQLIQSEKMASLGELTAGIAHEIQNPLNFINNFSEVSRELVGELKEEIDKGDTDEVKLIAGDLEQNLEKINHHGKRADAIVKGMLEHSRKSSGHKEFTDINALGDEYLRLAYHGMRAKDKTFSAARESDFDNKAGKINIIAQDIGRVLLNLFNNAFYAVTEKAITAGAGYQPTVAITTKRKDGKVIIVVSDNGNGIPKNITDKIFQPFFTTKPTGQGTGLGLSLSYDIIAAHEGDIKVDTQEGEGTKFIISLPA